MDGHAADPLSALRAGLSRAEIAVRRLGAATVERYPALRTPVLLAWTRYMLAYGACRALATTVRGNHRAAVDPFTVVEVDPDRIRFLVESDGYPNQIRRESVFPPPKFKHAGGVDGGDWDALDHRFEDTELYRGFEARFERRVPWRETAFYRTSVEYIEGGTPLWGCTTEAEFERRCAFVESLYDAIATNGYRSQAELSATDSPDSDGNAVRTVTDEIAVCVGRGGELLFMDGRNRLAIAKLLDLDAVPVWIMVRHEGWQRVRDSVAADPSRIALLPERLRTHPDLAGVRSGAWDRRRPRRRAGLL
ncbi:hypothetical protein [Halorubrum trueperi]|uniref:ParB/Sulfiredoxin domain-containing protein n=1 Tax=Halorubrum trueperi TaxID=2004704 RepID=A0ABD5UIY3_9EURY